MRSLPARIQRGKGPAGAAAVALPSRLPHSGAVDLTRSLLLRASRSRWLAEQFRRRAFARRAVRRFMPGEHLDAALDAASTFAKEGIATVLTQLGERVGTVAEAGRVADHYTSVLETVRTRGLPTQISVKLTHLGLDIDRSACTQHVLALAARAAITGSFIWIDMEESRYVDATLDVLRTVRAAHPTVGVCLQVYLERTPADIEALRPLAPAIRLVKGAYREPPHVALVSKHAVDERFAALADRLLEFRATGGSRPAFGTHDMRLVERVSALATARSLTADDYETQMLYGINTAGQRALARRGPVRVLVSYGAEWFAWYMRRLAERPANLWFVIRNVVP